MGFRLFELDHDFRARQRASQFFNPLTTLRQKQRHNHTPIRYREPLGELNEAQRHHVLRGHCRTRGRQHDYQIDTREGRACIWCGRVDPEAS